MIFLMYDSIALFDFIEFSSELSDNFSELSFRGLIFGDVSFNLRLSDS